MNQAEQNIYGQNTNFGFPKNQRLDILKRRRVKNYHTSSSPILVLTQAPQSYGKKLIQDTPQILL